MLQTLSDDESQTSSSATSSTKKHSSTASGNTESAAMTLFESRLAELNRRVRENTQVMQVSIEKQQTRIQSLVNRVNRLEAAAGRAIATCSASSEELALECINDRKLSALTCEFGSEAWIVQTYSNSAQSILQYLKEFGIDQRNWRQIFRTRREPDADIAAVVLRSMYTTDVLAKFVIGKPAMTKGKTKLPYQREIADFVHLISGRNSFDSEKVHKRLTSVLREAQKRTRLPTAVKAGLAYDEEEEDQPALAMRSQKRKRTAFPLNALDSNSNLSGICKTDDEIL